jgi:HK97 family phage portal protein
MSFLTRLPKWAQGVFLRKSQSGCDTFSGLSGYGDAGIWHDLNSLDGTGFQRNLSPGALRACGAVFACVNVCGQAIATMPMGHHRKLETGGREQITTSALSRILLNPNWYQTRSDFMLNLVFNLLYNGNAYAVAFRNDRQEVESLHLIPGRNGIPYVDPETKAIFYAIGENPLIEHELTFLVPARDILHIRLYTPNHPLVGVSPVTYAGLAISTNMNIGGNQAAFFSNMSRPSGIITTDEKLTSEQMDMLRLAWEEKSKGLNAGRVPVLGWGMKWQPMTITSEDAQLIEAYRMSIEDIARVFRVPLALIGDYTKATYANTEQLINSWLSTGLGFLMEHIEASFAKFFRLSATEVADFDVNALVRTDFAGRIDGLTKAVQGGLYSPNEARSREGLPAVEYGDEPRVQAQNLPLSAIGKMPETPATPPTPEAAPIVPLEPEPTAEQRRFAAWTAEQAIRKAMAA